jgi:hypothetical protein
MGAGAPSMLRGLRVVLRKQRDATDLRAADDGPASDAR